MESSIAEKTILATSECKVIVLNAEESGCKVIELNRYLQPSITVEQYRAILAAPYTGSNTYRL